MARPIEDLFAAYAKEKKGMIVRRKDKGPSAPHSRLKADPARPMSRFMNGEQGALWEKWRPTIHEPLYEVGRAYRSAAARSIDLIQNVGWISGAIDQATANTVVGGLRLDACPDPKALGMSPAAAKKWAKAVEERFAIYAKSPAEVDIEGRLTLGQMQAQAFRSYLATGDVVAEHVWRERPGCQWRSKVRVVPAHRLAVHRTNYTERLVQGVRLDQDWIPVGYVFEYPDLLTGNGEIIREKPARDMFGRKIISHVFDGQIGAVRGLTPIAPVLRIAKRFDELSDATLMSAIIQSVFAATLTTTMPTAETMEGLLSPAELAKAATRRSTAISRRKGHGMTTCSLTRRSTAASPTCFRGRISNS